MMTPDEEAMDAVTGGALGWWGLDAAATVVRGLLHEVFSWRNESIAYLADPTLKGDLAGDAITDEAFTLTYKEMACSQTAVGAVAPLLETLISLAIRHRRKGKRQLKYKGRDPVRQIESLLEAVKGSRDLPDLSWVAALFKYRNVALHNGYEWPPDMVAEFVKQIGNNKWEKWFGSCTSDGTPIFISLRDDFVHTSLQQLEIIAIALRKATEP
jgi:hypothetical protein